MHESSTPDPYAFDSSELSQLIQRLGELLQTRDTNAGSSKRTKLSVTSALFDRPSFLSELAMLDTDPGQVKSFSYKTGYHQAWGDVLEALLMLQEKYGLSIAEAVVVCQLYRHIALANWLRDPNEPSAPPSLGEQ